MSDVIHSSPSVANSTSLKSGISQDVDNSSMHKSSSISASSKPSDILSEILVLPKLNQDKKKQKRKPALTSEELCITNDKVLEQLKVEANEKQVKAEEVAKRKQEREQKKTERKKTEKTEMRAN